MTENAKTENIEPDAMALHLEAYRQMLTLLFIVTLSLVLAGTVVSMSFFYFGDSVFGSPEAAVQVERQEGVDAEPTVGDRPKKDLPILLAVGLFGAIGALVSALMRLYTLRQLPQALINPRLKELRKRKFLWMYASTPIIVGFIGAVIVYLSVMAGIISGGVFPEMICTLKVPENCNSFSGMYYYAPKTASDIAKAFVLAFASGFSERLVKDVLHRFEKS